MPVKSAPHRVFESLRILESIQGYVLRGKLGRENKLWRAAEFRREVELYAGGKYSRDDFNSVLRDAVEVTPWPGHPGAELFRTCALRAAFESDGAGSELLAEWTAIQNRLSWDDWIEDARYRGNHALAERYLREQAEDRARARQAEAAAQADGNERLTPTQALEALGVQTPLILED